MTCAELPLFPLRAVLFPDGVMKLRIFERRYLDMVRDCARDGVGFGVCLVLEGHETGVDGTSTAAWGTEARIEDFDSLSDGLLGITVRGVRRFRVLRTRVRDSGLIVADVEWTADPMPQPVAPEYGLLALLVAQLIDRFGGLHAGAGRECFDDANWVAWRLGEFLPLSLTARQGLLQQADANVRLQQIIDELPQLRDAADA